MFKKPSCIRKGGNINIDGCIIPWVLDQTPPKPRWVPTKISFPYCPLHCTNPERFIRKLESCCCLFCTNTKKEVV